MHKFAGMVLAGVAGLTCQVARAEAWVVTEATASIPSAGVSLPVSTKTLTLARTSEIGSPGEGVDNMALYVSAETGVTATVYIFFPGYADTGLAATATDIAVRSLYGRNVKLDSDALATTGGVPRAAIRRIYEGGVLPRSGSPVTTAAAFVRAGHWLAKFRVTALPARRPDVEAALDDLIAGLQFGKSKPAEAFTPKVAAKCAGRKDRDAKPAPSAGGGAERLADALVAALPSKSAEGQPTFPADGKAPLCARGSILVGGRIVEVLFPANASDGEQAIVLFNDSGGALSAEPSPVGTGFQVKRYGLGKYEVLGSFQSMPSNRQLEAILNGNDRAGSAVRAVATLNKDTGVVADIGAAQ